MNKILPQVAYRRVRRGSRTCTAGGEGMICADLGWEKKVGESLWAEVIFELDLEIWDFFCSFPLSIGIRKKNSHKSMKGAWKRPGKPSAWLCTCCSGRYLQNCWLRLRREQERVEDSQRNFVKYFFFSVIFHFIKCLYGFISLHLPLVYSDNIWTLQTAPSENAFS